MLPLSDHKHLHKLLAVQTTQVIVAVERRFEEDPNQSTRHRAQDLNICPFTFLMILLENFCLQIYKIKLVQK